MNAISSTIQNLPIFNGLAADEKNALLQIGQPRKVPRGEMLFAQGDTVKHFYIVTSGAMQLFRSNADGGTKTIALVRSAQTVNEDEIMDSCHGYRVNCVALEDATVLEFPAKWLKDAAGKYPNFALNLLSMIASRAHAAELEAEHLATMSAPQLVACFMQRLCVLHDFDPKNFKLPYSKTIIASRLGMEIETFSRTLAKLKSHGIVVEGNNVSITNLDAISDYVCDACSVSGACATHQALEKKLHKLN